MINMIFRTQTQVCVVHKGRPVAGVINEVFAKDEAAVWGVTLDGEDGFKVRITQSHRVFFVCVPLPLCLSRPMT